ncbi:MAG TPA: F0F1 ATP synthase subunit A [Longimicrobium sp.]|jgi:F-type H+-transporting ATPase subunit a
MMNYRIALAALLFATAPLAAQDHSGAAPDAHAPQAGHATQPAGTTAEVLPGGHAAPATEGQHSGEFDPMHHIQDGQSLEFQPFGEIHLPAKGSFMVGPVDMTPTRHTVFLALAGFLVVVVFSLAGQAAKRREAASSPGRKRWNIVEVFALYIRDQVIVPNIGHGGEKYAGYLLTLFFLILFSNLLGLLPFGATATANIAVTAALAFMVFVVVEVSGMVALGPMGYLKTIVYIPKGLPWPLIPVMAVIMTPVELLGKLAKPFALAVRLMANMMAGHIVLLSLFSVALAFGATGALGPLVMGAMLTFLELFVAFLQAYVFVVLSSVFIGMIRHAH